MSTSKAAATGLPAATGDTVFEVHDRDYDAQVGVRLREANVARQRIEQDAHLLSNRISHLRTELHVQKKHLDRTRLQTTETADLKRRNEERRQEKEETKFMREKALHDRREHLFRRRDMAKAGLQEVRDKTLSARQEKRNDIKEQSFAYATQNVERKAMEDEKVQRKHDRIRTAAIALARRQRQDNIDRMTAKHNVENRINEYERARRHNEELINVLEREEVDLVQQLQNNFHRQQSAYEKLMAETSVGTTFPLSRSL